MTYTAEQLAEILEKHKAWREDASKGERANLSNADLSNADLSNAKNIFVFNKFNGRTCYAVVHNTGLMIQAGCFWGTIDEFEAAAQKQYGNNTAQNYAAQIVYLRALEKEVQP